MAKRQRFEEEGEKVMVGSVVITKGHSYHAENLKAAKRLYV